MIPNQTTIAIDKETRAMIKTLAGDMPVHRYVKELAQRELANKQGTLPMKTGRREPLEARFERMVEGSIRVALAKFGITVPEKMQNGRDMDVIMREWFNEWLNDMKARAESEQLPGFEVSK